MAGLNEKEKAVAGDGTTGMAGADRAADNGGTLCEDLPFVPVTAPPLPSLLAETEAEIRESLSRYAGEDGGIRPFRFFFCEPEDDSYRFWEEEHAGIGHTARQMGKAASLAVGIFESLGCEPSYGDTVEFSFSQNRCWWSVTYDRCIRDFGYTLPVSDDVRSLALLVHYVAKGELQMLAFPA